MRLRSFYLILLTFFAAVFSACNYATHRTISDQSSSNDEDPEPKYEITLDEDYQDFVTYAFMGNRVENFSTYFNTYYIANEDFETAVKEYRTSTIANYNRRLDSLNVTPPVSNTVKEKLTSVIERASKVIQYHKNSKFIDDAVLLIGKSNYMMTDYPQAERKFNEFISKLSASDKSDEAILYLGRTKFKLGKDDEAVAILSNLVKNSTDAEIKASAFQELGIYAFNRKRYDEAVEFFKSAISSTKDNEIKAEREFILAKMYSFFKPDLSAGEYLKAVNLTSDFDLSFYSRLNYAKSLNYNNNHAKALGELETLKRKYRDDILYRQQIDLEYANTLYNKKDYEQAKKKYFEVIIDYPSTVASADAYYKLGEYYETVKKDYLQALVNYKKASVENSSSDYFSLSNDKAATFDRYFSLIAAANNGTKVEVPQMNKELEAYRIIYNESKGIKSTDTQNPGDFRGRPPGDEGEGKGKPGGYRSKADTLDGIDQESGEDVILNNEDQIKDDIKNNSLDEKGQKELEESLDEDAKFNAYYELAEIFLYELNQKDSAEFYLNKILTEYPDTEDRVKILYVLGNFYRNNNEPSRSTDLYNKIVEEFPNTTYAVESRKALGLPPIDISKEPAEDIYKKALRDLDSGNYRSAIYSLNRIRNEFPQSTYAPKSVYTLGWIYENKFKDADSTAIYYTILWEKYPDSEYSTRVTPVLEFLLSEKTKTPSDTTDVTTEKQTPVEKDLEQQKTEEGLFDKEEEKDHNPQIKEEDKERLSEEEIEKLLKESGQN